MPKPKKELPSTKQSPTQWAIRRDIPFAILGWLAVVLIVFWLLGHISRTILLLIIAAFLAYALVPAIHFFERFLPRFFAILIVYLFVFTGLGIVFYLVITTAIQQFAMLAHSLNVLLVPKDHNTTSPLVQTMKRFGISQQQLNVIADQSTGYAQGLTNNIIPFLTSIFSSILDTLIIAVMSIYLLLDGERIINWIRNNMPTTEKARIQFLLNTLQRIVGGYIRGQLLLSAIIGVLVGIGMALFHVPYAVLLGVLAFLFEFIPILGTFVSGAICVLLALTQGWLVSLFVLIYFIIIHVIEGDILGPRIVGKALGLHPLVSILALIAGTELYGIVGALLASPVAGVGQAVIIAVWSEWKATHPDSFAKSKHKVVQQINENVADKPVGPRKKR